MADPLQTLVTQYPQEARSYTPTWREYLSGLLMGDKPSQPKRDFVSGLMGSTGLGSTGMGLADVTPLGALMGMQESYRAGDPQGMALAVAPFGVGARGVNSLSVRAAPRLSEIADASFVHNRLGGNKMMDIEKLQGGVRMSDPSEQARVAKLAGEMSGPDGYIQRLVIDDAGSVIEGQHRLEAMRQLGHKKVPVSVIEDMARGVDISALQEAIRGTGKLHPDQVNGVIRAALDAAREAGGASKALGEYSLPGFQAQFDAALKAMAAP